MSHLRDGSFIFEITKILILLPETSTQQKYMLGYYMIQFLKLKTFDCMFDVYDDFSLHEERMS